MSPASSGVSPEKVRHFRPRKSSDLRMVRACARCNAACIRSWLSTLGVLASASLALALPASATALGTSMTLTGVAPATLGASIDAAGHIRATGTMRASVRISRERGRTIVTIAPTIVG
jgi:hypothetical protein